MKFAEARAVMSGKLHADGFMVHFERVDGKFLVSDYFPDKHSGEPLIPSEEEAWTLAQKFAAQTVGQCVNLYVIDGSFSPVANYRDRVIENRPAAQQRAA